MLNVSGVDGGEISTGTEHSPQPNQAVYPTFSSSEKPLPSFTSLLSSKLHLKAEKNRLIWG